MDSGISHVALQQGDIRILIIGGGSGGHALLELFYHYRNWIFIDGIVDLDANAIGMKKAATLNIPTYINAQEAVESFTGHLIIDVTGNSKLADTLLHKTKLHDGVEVISKKSSRLLFDLVTDDQKHIKSVENKDLHLNLLNAMLDLSLKLEAHQDTSEVVQHAITGLQQSLQARKSLAILVDGEESECFGILGDVTPPPLPKSFVQKLHALFEAKEHKGKSFLSLQPQLIVPEVEEAFDLAIPLIHKGELQAVLLIEHMKALDNDTKKMLEVTSSHLNLAIQTNAYNRELEYQAVRDPLTNVYNRRYFNIRLDEEFSRLQREQQDSLSCMFFDLDHFKQINDQNGHEVGDALLIEIARILQQQLRSYDIVARYGGDEFIALLPGSVGKELPLENIAGRILEAIQSIQLAGYEHIHPNVSIGVSCVRPLTIQKPSELVSLADLALYQAKEDGKGCVRLATPKLSIKPKDEL